jgi:hypothetical protein
MHLAILLRVLLSRVLDGVLSDPLLCASTARCGASLWQLPSSARKTYSNLTSLANLPKDD